MYCERGSVLRPHFRPAAARKRLPMVAGSGSSRSRCWCSNRWYVAEGSRVQVQRRTRRTVNAPPDERVIGEFLARVRRRLVVVYAVEGAVVGCVPALAAALAGSGPVAIASLVVVAAKIGRASCRERV